MKWLSYDMNEAELKAAYRNLSRKWHPDLHQTDGLQEQAEANMKEINEEYADCCRGLTQSFDRNAAANDMAKICVLVREFLKDVYPRLDIHYIASYDSIGLRFPDGTKLKKMVECIDLANTFSKQQVYGEIGKRTITVEPTSRLEVYIACDRGMVEGLDYKPVGNGRRYKQYACGKRFQKVVDTKESRTYYIKVLKGCSWEELT